MKAMLENACRNAILHFVSKEAELAINMTSRVTSRPERALAGIKNIIIVASGKGGVGKSTVAVNLALGLAKKGASVGLIDADIYGPSIPLMFGLKDQLKANADNLLMPIKKHNISIVSVGLLNQNKAMIWRGPMVHQMVHAFLTQTAWGELDYLVIDLQYSTKGRNNISYIITEMKSINSIITYGETKVVRESDLSWSRNGRIDDILGDN